MESNGTQHSAPDDPAGELGAVSERKVDPVEPCYKTWLVSLSESGKIFFFQFVDCARKALTHIVLATFLLATPWLYAYINSNFEARLQWVLIASRNISWGSLVQQDDVDIVLRKVDQGELVITTRAEAVGRRALMTIRRGELVRVMSLE